MSIEIQPYFAEGERYPALIGVRAEGDEYETAYVSKSESMDTLAENAMLREIIADLEEFLPESERWYSHETVKAISENNAKLRELVRDMFRDFANADYELKRNHGKTFMAVTRYEPRLQELGIEVTE